MIKFGVVKKSQTNHIWNGESNKQTNLSVLNFKFNYAISHLGCVWLRSEIEWSGSILNFKDGIVSFFVWLEGWSNFIFMFGWRDKHIMN